MVITKLQKSILIEDILLGDDEEAAEEMFGCKICEIMDMEISIKRSYKLNPFVREGYDIIANGKYITTIDFGDYPYLLRQIKQCY